MKKIKSTFSIAVCIGLLLSIPLTYACTRAVYQGTEGLIITGRSMDWKDDIPANLWLFPRGVERDGAVGKNSVKWVSKYGSVVASAFDIATADGMNEKGLVANLLWLSESRYPEYDGNTQGLSVSAWVQYVLDNFASVEEAVEVLGSEPFVVVSANIPGTERFATLHLSVSDATGDNAIFEYVDGKLVIHHGKDYTVMTNSPLFEKQIALNEYWKQIGGLTMLPGTNRAADRFVRASFYMDAIPKTNDEKIAVPSVLSVIRNASVPFGISSEQEPNISSTRWRSVSDQTNLVYYFETALTPNTFWVDIKKVDFQNTQESKRLLVAGWQTYSGETSDSFEAATPFVFAGL